MLVEIQDKSVTPDPVIHGGKGAGLIWMFQNGINVPPALIIPTTVCVDYMKAPKGTMKKIGAELYKSRGYFKAFFGYQPLLSVRSGARSSMPGMMDTILNVGLDNKTLHTWEARIGSDCSVDSFKRLITMYGNVVGGFPRKDLEKGTLPEALAAYERMATQPFPEAEDQLLNSIEAVFKSWNNDRAKTYRKLNNIPDDWGTAVVIQAMVFGNMNENSGTGVLFTRDPDTGANEVVGEFLMNAQGEDVVAGTATPMKLPKLAEWNPQVSLDLINTVSHLEKMKADVQDVEFTIQDGKLFILQTRTAKRSAGAAVKIAWDMVEEGMISMATALTRVSERELDLSNMPVIDPKFHTPAFATGIPACTGVVTGKICLTSKGAVAAAAQGQKVVLVSEETTPDDIAGMNAAIGILTMTGGSTSHAAVVARSMNRCCVVGLGTDKHHSFKDGEVISLDGASGRVWLGEVPTVGGNNPLVALLRAARIQDQPLLVTDVPKFKVTNLCLQLGSVVHLTDEVIEKLIKGCQDQCTTLSLSYTTGSSELFMTDKSIQQRLVWIRGLVPGAKVYGFGTDDGGSPIACNLSLQELVLSTTDIFVQSVAQDWTPAEKKVLNWLKKDGLGVHPWNAKGGAAPASYSVLTGA